MSDGNQQHVDHMASICAGHVISCSSKMAAEASLGAAAVIAATTTTVCELVRACKTPAEIRELTDKLSHAQATPPVSEDA